MIIYISLIFFLKTGELMKKNFLFTSESVSEGHPDKVCDRISDMVVDTFLASEPEAREARDFNNHKQGCISRRSKGTRT